MRKIFFVLFVGCLLALALFPKQILLKCIAWKAANYCQEAFGSVFTWEDLEWSRGKIRFIKGTLLKEDEVEATFKEANLIPFFDLKKRFFGGKLKIKTLKIVHRKKEPRPIPSPPPPQVKLFTLKLDTTIERGELLLYDYLSRHHFFQHATFDLAHHVLGKETWGSISFALDPEAPKFVSRFKDCGDTHIELTAHFQSHYLPDLSHLVTYFFQSYLPEPAFQWEVLQGSIDGDLELSLFKGAPAKMRADLSLKKIQGENQALKLFSEVEEICCQLDVDFASQSKMNGEFSLLGGRVALFADSTFWEGIWDLKNIHSQMRIRDGVLHSSTLHANLMGMEGELLLDWQASDVLMKIGFRGASKEMYTLLPEKIQKKFAAAFPDDFFRLKAKLKRLDHGLKLEGKINIENTAYPQGHCLEFGCQLGSQEGELVNEQMLSQPVNVSLSRSVDQFLKGLKQQFCLSQKRFGWFEGEDFPLEKFLAPFLLDGVPMRLSGLADFKGTFDDRYVVIFYTGRDFEVESSHFRFQVDRVREHSVFGVSAVHYIDLDTWNHVGFLPLKEARYWQKNYDFHLLKTNAIVNFENNVINIQNISTTGEEIDFTGGVHIGIRSLEDIDLKIFVDTLKGSAANARRFLTHFKASPIWQLPIEGEVASQTGALNFHYHFNPAPVLLKGEMHGEVLLNAHLPFFRMERFKANVDYDCRENTVAFSESTAEFFIAGQEPSFLVEAPALVLKNFPDFMLQGSAEVFKEGKPLLRLLGSTKKSGNDRDFFIDGVGCAPFDRIAIQATHESETHSNSVKFVCGEWKGEGKSIYRRGQWKIENFSFAAAEKASLSFAGIYDSAKKTLRGKIKHLHYDLSRLVAPFEKGLKAWQPQGSVSGTGSLSWQMGDGVDAQAQLSFHDLGFGGLYFGDGKELRCKYVSSSGFTVEGLEAEVPLGDSVEKYKLGRFHYDIHQEKVLFEGFDFSLPPEKLPWITDVAEKLFPGKIHPAASDWMEALKKNEPLEGRISLEIDPEKVGIHLNLKDGIYFLSDTQLDLKNFHLVYDPQELNIWSQCLYQDNYYWLHLVTDSMTMQQGKVSLSERELSFDKRDELVVLRADWEREKEKGWSIRQLEGIFSGMDISLRKENNSPEQLTLKGRIGFNPAKIAGILHPSWRKKIEQLSLAGGFALEGGFAINKNDMKDIAFVGSFLGSNCQVCGVSFSAFSSFLDYKPDNLKISELAIKDWAGRMCADEIILSRSPDQEWNFLLNRLTISDLRFSRLKSPWTKKTSGGRNSFRSLFVPKFKLDCFTGIWGKEKSYLGEGTLQFTNLPKKTLFTNLLFLPMEITARIGLDLSNLVPVRGAIDYHIGEGKVYFNEFREMYSDGKRSRFYLAEGMPAYIDFKGNLNLKVKMKQYNLLMKLAEFFTITVKGTLLHPSYTFSNHIDDDEES